MTLPIFQAIMDDRQIAYLLTDPRFRVVETGGSERVLQLEGLLEAVGCSLAEVLPEAVGAEQTLHEILDGDLPKLELRWVNREAADTSTRYLNLTLLPHSRDPQQEAGLLCIIEDVTVFGAIEQRVIQQRNEARLLREELARQNIELAVANAELKRLDDMKSTFVSIAAHELRTPLASIEGFAEMLLDGDYGSLSDRQRESLEIIQKSSDRLLDVTKNLLDVTRIEMGRIEISLRRVSLPALIDDVISELGPQVRAKGQYLTVNIDKTLPDCLCDPTRTEQILGNLLSNANKYTPREGRITLTVAHAAAAGFVEIAIADDGIGIPPEDQAQLFERFFRAKNANQSNARGSGLGLYITKSLVELHGGTVRLKSAVEQGTTFYVTLPLVEDG